MGPGEGAPLARMSNDQCLMKELSRRAQRTRSTCWMAVRPVRASTSGAPCCYIGGGRGAGEAGLFLQKGIKRTMAFHGGFTGGNRGDSEGEEGEKLKTEKPKN
jgi:hypothetical protein